jgi:ribosomal protein L30
VNVAKRHYAEVNFPPLPLSYAAAASTPAASTPAKSGKYPFAFYQITLRRGLIGINAPIKHVVHSLGLSRRHETVWRRVSPKTAGQILRVKELVTVELVNEIPQRVETEKGYNKVASIV